MNWREIIKKALETGIIILAEGFTEADFVDWAETTANAERLKEQREPEAAKGDN